MDQILSIHKTCCKIINLFIELNHWPVGNSLVVAGPNRVEGNGGLSNDVVVSRSKEDVVEANVLDPDELLDPLQVVLELDRVARHVGADQLAFEVVSWQEGLHSDQVFVQVGQHEVDAPPLLQTDQD